MSKKIQSTSNPTVAEYVVARLADLGIGHVFGVPGDVAFPIDNAIEANDRLTWIGCSNELNAAYSADGYARIHGAAILCTTFVVGETSALTGVMGSKSERLPVFHLVGAPSSRLMKTRRLVHHTFGDGEADQFRALSAVSACACAFLTPQNAIAEVERVISAALSQRRPGYIQIPQDYALMPVVGTPIRGVPLAQAPTFSSQPRELDAALKAIMIRLAKAKSPVILPAFTIARYGLRKELKALLAATGIPFAACGMDKAVISESHPLYLGMYQGDASKPDVRKIVEGADLVLNLGGVLFGDIPTSCYGYSLDPSKMVTVWPDYVEIGAAAVTGGRGNKTFGPIHMKDILVALTNEAPKFKTPSFPRPPAMPEAGASADRISYPSLYSRIQQFLAPDDILCVDPSTSAAVLPNLLLPEGVLYLDQPLWGCIGWGTPAAFGAALADPSRRVILVQGDGGHQLTANQIGTMGRYGVNPIILLVNNGIFGIEEIILLNSDSKKIKNYDQLAPWQYHKLPEAMGCRDWFCKRVETNADLDSALQQARKHPGAAYIEIVPEPKMANAAPPELVERMYQATLPPAEKTN
jgi:indolepyruvate decarboxylase